MCVIPIKYLQNFQILSYNDMLYNKDSHKTLWVKFIKGITGCDPNYNDKSYHI